MDRPAHSPQPTAKKQGKSENPIEKSSAASTAKNASSNATDEQHLAKKTLGSASTASITSPTPPSGVLSEKKVLIFHRKEKTATADRTQEDGLLSKKEKSNMSDELPSAEAVSERMILLEQSARNLRNVARTPVEKLDQQHRVLRAVWEELEKQEWYHGMIPIEDVKTILKENGDFLVRKSENEIKSNPPVLTVMWNSILHHFPLYAVQRTKTSVPEFTINMVMYSPNYSALINDHWMRKIPVFRNVLLITSAPKQAWELDKDNVTMENKIGEGQFGEVWKGRLKVKNGGKVDSVIVAVKIMKVTTNSQPQLQMFHQEARLMRMYDHRNVVKLHGLVFSDTDLMVVMEFVSGGALNSYLKHNKLMPLIKASFCYDIAAGLAYLHSRNCMHRDVAARNCLVTSDGRMLKLSDFGLAVHGRRIKLANADRVPIRWQAPEVLFYHIYMRESDVWSYGMLMSEIFNDGKVPFHDKPIAEIRSRIHDPKFRPFVPSFQAIYRIIPKVMYQCWEVDVTKRPTMQDISKSLRGFCIHTVTEKSESVDSKQKFIDRVKTDGYVESVTVGSRMDGHHPVLKQIITTSLGEVKKTKNLSKEKNKESDILSVQPTIVDETEDHLIHDQRLKPFVPSHSPRPSRSPPRKDDQPQLLKTQPQNVIAKPRQSQQLRKSTSKKGSTSK